MARSKSFGSEVARIPHLAQAGGSGLVGELGDVRADVETAFSRLEGRVSASNFPEIDWLDGTVAAAGGDIVLQGRNLLQGQTFAGLTLFTGTSELVFTALTPGVGGNAYTVEIQDTGSASVTVTGTAIVITIDAGTTTANGVATLVNANGAETDGLVRCNGGGTGTAMTVTAGTSFTGGAGEGVSCLVSGVACLPANTAGTDGAAAITDTKGTFTVPDLTALTPARAATDTVAITVLTDGIMTQSLSAALA